MFFSFLSQGQTNSSKETIQALLDSTVAHLSDSSRSMKFAQKALKLSLKIKSNSFIGKSYLHISDVYYAHAHFSEAIDELEKSKLFYAKSNSYKNVVYVLGEIGVIYEESGDFDKASEYYFEGLSLCEKHGITNNSKAWLLRYLGSVYTYQDKYVEAREVFQQAHELFKVNNDHDGMASSLNSLGYTYVESDDSTALAYFKEALAICSEYNLKSRSSLVFANIGWTYEKRGNYDKSLEYYERELNYYLEFRPHKTYEIAFCRADMAKVHVLKGNYKYATELLEMAGSIGNEAEAKRDQILERVYFNYSLLHEKTNNHQLALFYDNLSDSLYDLQQTSVHGAEIDKVKFKYERREISNQAKNDKYILEQNASNQRNWIIGLSIGFTCLLFLGLIIYFQKRRLRKAHEILVQRNLDIAQKQLLGLEIANSEKKTSEKDTDRYSNSALTEEQKQMLLEDVMNLVESDKLYLDSNLTVQMLAESLGTNKSYVSQIINEKLNMNFSSFINEYRINEVIIAFRNEEFKNLTIEGIAKSIGFRSMSAFNSAFKKHTGITPSKFVKSL